MAKKILKEIALIVFVSLAGSTLLTFFTCPTCSSDVRRYFLVTLFSSLLWIILWAGNSIITKILSAKILWTQTPIKRLIWGIGSTAAYTIVAGITISRIWEVTLNFDFGGYYSVILSALLVTFLISFFLHGREFLLQWIKSNIDAERLKKENVIAQYESLKNQVNPHFLFNSLNALTNLIHGYPDKATAFVKQLSEVYRYVLDTRAREMVAVADELRFVESYIFLQQIRFGDKLVFENAILQDASMVAPLALQILIENAIKHNEVSSDYPLFIRLYADQHHLVVENSLRKKSALPEVSTGVGLSNIKNRYRFLTNREVSIIESEGTFAVLLPKIEAVY